MASEEDCDIEILTKLLETAEKDISVVKMKTCLENKSSDFLQDVANFESRIFEIGDVSKKNINSELLSKDINSKVESNDVLHNGDMDSSDDEEKRNHNLKYNQCGKEIKTLISNEKNYIKDTIYNKPSWKTKCKDSNNPMMHNIKHEENHSKHLLTPYTSSELQVKNEKVYVDPTFGIRIINPLISQSQIREKMVGREYISMSRIKSFLLQENKDIDWVISGVIVVKSNTKVSQNGNQYIIWTISDLKDNLKTVSVFLFRGAHKTLWKISKGTVVAILNPNILEKRDGSKDEACLSIDNSDRVMILGQSKDLGVCKSKKLNGDLCTAFVNVNVCEYCVYHIKQEYKKMSMRSELQSSCAGRGLNALRNKVLGKNEVFYAGKSYTAIPAKRSKKLVDKDTSILNCLSKTSFYSESKSQSSNINRSVVNQNNARRLETSVKQRLKDIERLKKLGSTNVSSGALVLGVSEPTVKCDTVHFTAITQEICKTDKDSFSEVNKRSKIEENKILNHEKKTVCTSKDNSIKPIISEDVYNSSPLFVNSNLSTKKPVLKPVLQNNSYLKLTNSNRNSSEDKPETNLITNDKDKIVTNKSMTSNHFENKFLNKFTSETNSKTFLTPSEVMSSPKENFEKKKNTSQVKNTFSEKEVIKSACQNDKQSLSQTKKVTGNTDLVNINATNNETKYNSSTTLPSVPCLNKGSSNVVDLSIPINRKVMNRGRVKALNWIAKNGPILKDDPANKKARGIKRRRPDLFENSSPEKQKAQMSVKSKEFQAIMEAKSSHSELIEFHDQCAQENYFKRLENIEKMEEKMMSTFKVECKAVQCLKCKYTNFSASELCKTEGHPLKVFDSFKRFFMCSDCKNRTVTLNILPLVACKKCGANKWERTSMMKEKIANIGVKLSIRGDEETFINSFSTSSNLNLLVPE